MTEAFQALELSNKSECAGICDSILSELPDWFGAFDIYKDYMDDLKTRPVFVMRKGADTRAIMVLTKLTHAAVDIHLLAVRPEFHGLGIGKALVETAKDYGRSNGAKFLTVKTLGPSTENVAYSKTRMFYVAVGFEPLEEIADFWGKGYPMLL